MCFMNSMREMMAYIPVFLWALRGADRAAMHMQVPD